MSNPTLEGMARVIVESMGDTPENAARAALLYLADNVSDEMVMAYMTHKPRLSRDLTSAVRESISAALRAAAGDGK